MSTVRRIVAAISISAFAGALMIAPASAVTENDTQCVDCWNFTVK